MILKNKDTNLAKYYGKRGRTNKVAGSAEDNLENK